MNPTLVQHLAQYRMDSLDREAEAGRRAALAKAAATARPETLRDRLSRTVGRLRLIARTAAA